MMIAVFDNFIDNESQWLLMKTGNFSAQIKERVYEITNSGDNIWRIPFHRYWLTYENFYTLEISFKILSGSDDALFGMYWGSSFVEPKFWFGVEKNLKTLIHKKQNTTVVERAEIRFPPDPSQPMRLTLCKSANTEPQLGLNGLLVQEFKPYAGRTDEIGLFGQGRLTVEVYSFNLASDGDFTQLRFAPTPSYIFNHKGVVSEADQVDYSGPEVYQTSDGRFITDRDEWIEDQYQSGNRYNGE